MRFFFFSCGIFACPRRTVRTVEFATVQTHTKAQEVVERAHVESVVFSRFFFLVLSLVSLSALVDVYRVLLGVS